MNPQVSRIGRLGSMFVDHIVMLMICTVLFMPYMMTMFGNFNKMPHEVSDTKFNLYIALLGFALYICKDSFNGRSIAKRIFQTQVIDVKTNLTASPIKCMVRNLFCMLWPFEIIIVLASPSRRIGDFVAGTAVVYYNASAPKVKRSLISLLPPLVISYALLFILNLSFSRITNAFRPHVEYDVTTFNEEDSKQLTIDINNAMSSYLLSDVKVYNKSVVKNKRFIFITLNLKEDYMNDIVTLQGIRNEVRDYVTNKYGRIGALGTIRVTYSKRGRSVMMEEPL